MKEIDNILRILGETKRVIEMGNYSEMKNLSNQTINVASLTQDPDNLAVAVMIYSLNKIFERENYRNYPGWKKISKTIISSLEYSIEDLEKNNLNEFRKDFENIRVCLKKISGKLKEYIKEVFRKAQINKASRIYEHGISMEQTAKLLGITMFELADYAGKTGISDVQESKTLDAKSRIKIAEEIFG
ncbi:MAG: hypothetical protein AABX44_01465 [Nanoarchaeota archaeon]